MSNSIVQGWLKYSFFTSFFSDFSEWKGRAAAAPFADGWGGLLAGQQDEALQQEYDDLFKGTNASVYIPLWGSVCKHEDGSLLDETTLKIVRQYHLWGYAPVEMDGNPPDYIGQQLRFICYLLACACHGDSPEDYLRAAEEFTSLYLLDTVRAVAGGIRKYAQSPLFLRVADELSAALLEDYTADRSEKPDGYADILLCYESCLNGRAPEIPDSEPCVIKTAGRNNCGGKCSIHATVQDGCLLHLEAGCDIGTTRMRACVRGRGYRRSYLSGQRLRYPMKRIGERGEGRFKRISWEEAADIIAAEWVRIRDTYGPGSRYVNYGTGVSAVIRPDALVRRLLNLDGGYLGYFGTYSSACSHFVTPYIYGDRDSGNSMEDLPNTKLLLLWGHNPTETIFSPQISYQIAKAKENGAKVIVIDPRESDTAIAFADEWIAIRPSTDGALAAAMAHVMWSEGLQDQRFMDTYCIGFDADHMPDGVPKELNYHNYIFGGLDGVAKTPEWAEGVTGVPAETIRRLARDYATTKPACLMPGLANQRTGNGEQNARAMAMLTCMTGNIGIPGGGAAGQGYAREQAEPSFPTGQSDYPGVISFFLWTKAIEDGKNMTAREDGVQGMEKLDSDIKMFFNLASNVLINQHSDINHSIELLKDTGKCEFIVVSDVFMTPSVKFADIVLPAPSFLEEDNIAAPWRVGHYLLSVKKVVEPLFGCRYEYDWLGDVARRLDLWKKWSKGREKHTEWLEHLYEKLRETNTGLPDYQTFRQNGGHTYQYDAPYIAYAEQIADPDNCKFSTPSGKIEIFSKRLYDMERPDEVPALPSYLPCPEGYEDPLRAQYPLQLIGWHTKRRCHSIHDNNPWLEEVEPQHIWMHPDDAEARGLAAGDIAEVYNGRGRLQIPVTVTTRIMPGVVAIPQGGWYTPNEDGIDTRGSINVLTSTLPTPLAKGNPQHTNLVEVKRA